MTYRAEECNLELNLQTEYQPQLIAIDNRMCALS